MDHDSVNTASTNAEVTHVPSTWPGAFGLYKHSRKVVGYNLGAYLGVIGISLVLNIFVSLIFASGAEASEFTLADPLSWLISVLLGVATFIILMSAIKHTKITFSEALSQTWKYFGKAILLTLLTSIILFGSLLLFIIPFFFVLPRIALAMYYLIDGNLGVTESLRASWNQTRGHVGKFYGIVGVTLLMILPVLTIIGIPLTIYLVIAYSAALPILYAYITANKPVADTTNTGPIL